MEFHFVQSEYLNEKNITYKYTVNYFKSASALRDISTVKLSHIANEITDGTRVKRDYTDYGVKIINAGDFKDGTIYSKTVKCVSTEGIKDKDYIKENDILVTAVGKSGQIIRVPSFFEDYVISSDIIRIRLKQPSTAEGLFAYLGSKSGKYALESIKMGILNRISINDIKELEIPVNYKEMISNKMELLKKKREANKLYNETVKLFTKHLIQKDNIFDIPKMCFLESNKLITERLDPQYFSYLESKFFELTHRNHQDIYWQPLEQIVEIKRAIRPSMDENIEIQYINISNVDSDLSTITSNEKDLYKNLSSRIRYVLNENELITAKSGSATGTENHVTAIITKRYAGMMASDAFYNIKPIGIDPYYLLFLFKQPIILKQIEVGATGLYYRTLNRSEFEKISIPRLTSVAESEIADKMRVYIELLQK